MNTVSVVSSTQAMAGHPGLAGHHAFLVVASPAPGIVHADAAGMRRRRRVAALAPKIKFAMSPSAPPDNPVSILFIVLYVINMLEIHIHTRTHTHTHSLYTFHMLTLRLSFL